MLKSYKDEFLEESNSKNCFFLPTQKLRSNIPVLRSITVHKYLLPLCLTFNAFDSRFKLKEVIFKYLQNHHRFYWLFSLCNFICLENVTWHDKFLILPQIRDRSSFTIFKRMLFNGFLAVLRKLKWLLPSPIHSSFIQCGLMSKYHKTL